MNTPALTTDRLQLVAATFELVCAELESADRLGEMLGVEVDRDWPPGEYDRHAQEFFRDKLRDGGSDAVGWYSWYVILKSEPDRGAVLVGTGGFTGPPDDCGEVEIGYSVLPAWEGRGLATELVNALVRHAFANTSVLRIIAHAEAHNRGSRRVLEKSGFTCVGDGEGSGNLRFETSRNSPQPT